MAKKEAKDAKVEETAKKVEKTVKEETKEPIINTEAAKAKAEEVAKEAKEGASNLIEKIKTDKALTIICCVVLIVLVILILSGLGSLLSGTGKGTVKQYAKSMVNYDSKKFCKSFSEVVLEEEYDGLDECIEDMDEYFENFEDEDYKIKSYEIGEGKKLSDSKLEDLADDLEDDYDIDAKKVKKAYKYKVKFKVEDEDDSDTLKMEVYVAKINGKWGIVDMETDY